MVHPSHGFTLAELALVILIMTVLGVAIITGVLVRREQAYLEDVLIQSKKILEVAERFRTRVEAYNPNKEPLYYVWPETDTEDFNDVNNTSFPETNRFGEPYTIEIVNSRPGEKPRKSYAKVETVVRGKARPLRVKVEPVGDDTRLIFYTQYKWLQNRQIVGPAQFDKGVWFGEETR